jgi:hypothetical protein
MSNHADLNSLNKVWEVKALNHLNRSNEALALLNRIAHAVAPVMKRRKWKVLILKEFYPNQDGLLGMNVNKGQSILIRLRPPWNKNEFYGWEHVMGTMIHELTHMEIGPHNSDFYRLMDEIADEVDKDELSNINPNNGVTKNNNNNNSFDGVGHKLGGRQVAIEKDRLNKAKVIADATMKRLKNIQLTNGSGQKLSSASFKPQTKDQLRQMAVIAAERRLRDDQACRHGQNHDSIVPKSKPKDSTSSSSSSSLPFQPNPIPIPIPTTNLHDEDVWMCALCDSINAMSNTNCSFCSSSRSESSVSIHMSESANPDFSNDLCGFISHKSRLPSSEIIASEESSSNDSILSTKRTIDVIDGKSSKYAIVIDSPTGQTGYRAGQDGGEWDCPTCNLINSSDSSMCVACGTSYTLDNLKDRTIMKNNEPKSDVVLIPCNYCTYVNEIHLHSTIAHPVCIMCNRSI